MDKSTCNIFSRLPRVPATGSQTCPTVVLRCGDWLVYCTLRDRSLPHRCQTKSRTHPTLNSVTACHGAAPASRPCQVPVATT
eukprot:9251495-Prorocentrum_lima.AAC.1